MRADATAGTRLLVAKVSNAFDIGGASLPVLDRVSLEVAPGGFTALLGPSGCGKSTLLRLVAGLEPPGSRRIAVDGVLVEGPDPSRLLVFQDPTLYPWRTVRGNVALGLEARGVARAQAGRITATIDLVGLSGFADAYPHQLSGEMAQRAALARALVNDPRLLLLDERLGKLDALTRLANRRRFGEVFATAWDSSCRTGKLVSLILVDADHFKRFNDRYGHTGDDVLKGLAGACL
ncbi:Vitamin B12 import ATP-binding protein BtuD [Methylobacterium gnaphalii]|uniref:ABC transporter ATP-binding protein n=1 Tax=Methylobacterium gnaphalii TaxID=1010610 RepID=A0A512JRN1_9HYPH|nr:hypothetical protein MGN01_44170 [Methylobacterium gnaphalii]GJD69072.1 Vitamin B12 import ATP-binding protein BtuD [Methylobacterium gnaphalii]GLS47189.1 hypothetical protein GCM10007885_00310 [Methylobacterium gnaphalii]